MSGVLYLVDAACPHCEVRSRFVRAFDVPFPLMQDISVAATHCPKCGEPVGVDGWDVHEEAEIERVVPTQERRVTICKEGCRPVFAGVVDRCPECGSRKLRTAKVRPVDDSEEELEEIDAEAIVEELAEMDEGEQ